MTRDDASAFGARANLFSVDDIGMGSDVPVFVVPQTPTLLARNVGRLNRRCVETLAWP